MDKNDFKGKTTKIVYCRLLRKIVYKLHVANYGIYSHEQWKRNT